MPVFQYQGYNGQNKKIKGLVEASNKKNAFHSLKEQGLQITELEEQKSNILTKDIEWLEPKVRGREFVLFCRQFATLLRASIGISDALSVLQQQTTSKTLKKALAGVHEQVRSGSPLSGACMAYPKVFPLVFINMVRAGETSRSLDEVLERLALFFEKEHKTLGKIKSALVYPVTVTIIAIVVTFFLMWKVVPQFVSTFNSMGLELPAITRLVMGVSSAVTHLWYLFVLFPLLLFLVLKSYYKTKKGKYQLDFLKLKLPVFGVLFLKSSLARFSRTFCTLYSAAVPIMQILNIVSQVVGNEVITRSLEEARENLRAGQPLANPFRDNKVFPPMVVQMITVGERTGSLDTVMEKVADFYEEDVDRMADQLRSLIEPLMIVVVSGIVGVIVLAILEPTFALYKGLK